MTSEHENAEFVEMGNAEDLILGKTGDGPDDLAFNVIADEFDE